MIRIVCVHGSRHIEVCSVKLYQIGELFSVASRLARLTICMMWRLYVAAIPLVWFYLVSITYGSTNDTVVPRQKAGQTVLGNHTTTQDGSNTNHNTDALPPTTSTTSYATDTASKSDSTAKTPPQVAKDATRTKPPSPPAAATSQTLRSTLSARTILSESIIRTITTKAIGNQTPPTPAVGNRMKSTSEKDYLLTDVTTISVPFGGEEEETGQDELPRPPLDSITGSRPVIEKSGLKDKTVELGDDVRLTCHVQSVRPSEIWWEFNGIAIGQSDFFSIKTKPRASSLKINGASLEHAGSYTCKARNEFGTTVSPDIQVVVLMAPTFIKGPGNHSVGYGQLLNLSCTVEAYPPPRIAWFKNTEPLPQWTGKEMIVINVTESATYSCFYRNVIKDEDKFAARYGVVTVTGVRPSYCAAYNGATCRSQLPSSPYYIFVNGHGDEPLTLDSKLSEILSSKTMMNMPEDCQAGIRELLCHGTHPKCELVGQKPRGQKICKEDCEIVQSRCPDWAQLVNRFLDPLPDKIRSLGLSSCENLPENYCTSLWPLNDTSQPTTASPRVPTSPTTRIIPTTQSVRRTPSGLGEDPRDTAEQDPFIFLILVITIPSAVVILIGVSALVFGVRHYRGISKFTLPKNIDLSGMTENPMYGKNFNTSFNPQLAYLEYDRNSVIYEKDIGEGAFGRVFMATAPKLVKGEAETGVAVKVLKTTADKGVTEYFNREAQMIARFSHQNIIKLLGVCFVGRPLCLLLEYMSEGDLEDFLHSRSPHRSNSRTSNSPGSGLKTYEKLNMAKQIACGMAYLNEMMFVHRDIATRNCLINSRMDVKISDFGLARYVGHKECFVGHKEEHIPIRWTAPEALWDYQFTFASDVWSFGVLLWELFSYAEQPYLNLSHEDVFLHTRQGYRLSNPENTPHKVHQVMTDCWDANPSNRPFFKQLKDSLASMECEWLANGKETQSQ
ncbi:muscle, skeletal receptor tyrosine-protein kinase-like isoform X2 [Lytechinus variegatus]|uniref:muscle, skeletal receptor tyrosine-protein kinase-like isoform X2 n=1 Tax=Lytechinus variegatus TaxID=7654 RepID=UPI001BB13ADA|nr:muscle, skeletal receptor tyrosine-protein kinase-like isoform X2 [Lytechinus variegatus]